MSRKKKPKPGMTDEEKVALAALTSMGGSLAGEGDIGEMQALIAAAEQGGKKRPAGKKKPRSNRGAAMELEESSVDLPSNPEDKRLKMPEPPPVRLVAVEDVTLESSTEDATKLDDFFVDLLRFERDTKAKGIVYKAENHRVQFKVESSPLIRDDMRAIGIEVPSLADLELQLIERKFVYLKERALTLGHVTFLLRDPAGNWLRIGQVKRVL